MDRRVIDEIINKGKLDVADELFAPEYIYHGPGGQKLKFTHIVYENRFSGKRYGPRRARSNRNMERSVP